jgi:hypothetical protein
MKSTEKGGKTMRYANKTLRKRWILRFYGSLAIGFLIIFMTAGLSFAKHIQKHYPKHIAKAVTCGVVITTDTILSRDLNCDINDGSPALTVDGATLDLNGYRVIGDTQINCIEISGGATLKNGTVMNCRDGIIIRGDRNNIIDIISSNNDRRGFRIIGGNENWLYKGSARENGRQGFTIEEGGKYNRVDRCSAVKNGRVGFSIEPGDYNMLEQDSAMNNGQQGFSIQGEFNKIYNSKAKANCRDGIEINQGNDNLVINNLVEDNGNQETCDEQGDGEYKPWFYAGIDITNNSFNNKIKYNSACGNLGCVPCYDESEVPMCKARERNFWDENVDDIGDSVSTNGWENNRVECKNVVPEFSPEPDN